MPRCKNTSSIHSQVNKWIKCVKHKQWNISLKKWNASACDNQNEPGEHGGKWNKQIIEGK
jgi:hypothetical protein